VCGRTLVKLVELLTGAQGHDLFFVQTFLLTLHSFSSPDEVIDLLIQRCDNPPSREERILFLTLLGVAFVCMRARWWCRHAIPPRLRQGRSKDDWELYKLTVRSKFRFPCDHPLLRRHIPC
jgi:hypothetical protein